MTLWVAASLAVAAFVLLTRWLGLGRRSGRGWAVMRETWEVVRNSRLSDDQKEAALQDHARRLVRELALAIGTVSVAVALPAAILYACDRLTLLTLVDVWRVLVSPPFIAAGGIVMLAMFAWRRYRRRPCRNVQYSTLDRILHRIAFRSTLAQIGLADMEERLCAKRWVRCRTDRPIFITALPRAGTTLLLECCASLGEFASHCYRDMPFVLVPCLWQKFAGHFQRPREAAERAHGDGIFIDLDSPEALEEVLWKAFWKKHYLPDRITPWRNESHPEFEDFFRCHMQKVIWLRRGQHGGEARYLSKNNLNIARIQYLRHLFPDAAIVVPFRHPVHHAASLLEQHLRFLGLHDEDPFSRAYMEAIGHYDFGRNLRPIDFGGWRKNRKADESTNLTFWMQYWVVAYQALIDQRDQGLTFLDYDRFCEEPSAMLRHLAGAVRSRDVEAWMPMADRIRSPRKHVVDVGALPAELVQVAHTVHAALQRTVRV